MAREMYLLAKVPRNCRAAELAPRVSFHWPALHVQAGNELCSAHLQRNHCGKTDEISTHESVDRPPGSTGHGYCNRYPLMKQTSG